MSAITLSPSFQPRATVRPAPASVRTAPVRFTRRGKTVLLLGFLALALLAMVVFGSLAAATHDVGTPEPVRVVSVQSGDTLYDIAGDVASPGEVRSMMHRIKDLNALDSTTLEVGQRLAVPRG